MKILIIGSGGREHALVWKISQSPLVKKIFCAPGNPGIEKHAECLKIKADQLESLRDFALKEQVDLTIVGPDDCLASGIVDVFNNAGLKIFGPTKAAARIESSKSYAKNLMQQCGISTAAYAEFIDYSEACKYSQSQKYPLVIKADGLAMGKGVVICRSPEEGLETLRSMMVDTIFGKAGNKVIIEEFLEGQEVSMHAFCDGQTAKVFPPSQDHKPVYDGDSGPNTGGMGTYAPVPWITRDIIEGIQEKIIKPVLRALAEDGNPFIGCLYPGLIFTKDGFKVLEFNARFGDPETQSYMRLLKNDLVEIIQSCIDGNLKNTSIEWDDRTASCIIAAAGGYPGNYKKDFPISGIDQAEQQEGIVVFQAGTARIEGELRTAGGRVLGITAIGKNLEESLQRGYNGMSKIKFEKIHFRRDIGRKVFER